MSSESVLDQIIWGVAANLVCLLLSIGAALVLLVPPFGRIFRWRLRRFFGLGRRGTFSIRLSNIYVRGGGTISNKQVQVGFNGPAITEGEYVHALRLAAVVQTRPLLRAMRLIAQNNGLPIVDQPVTYDIGLSPSVVAEGKPQDERKDPQEMAALHDAIGRTLRSGGTYVLAGAPVYNAMVSYALEHFKGAAFAFGPDPEHPNPGLAPAEDAEWKRYIEIIQDDDEDEPYVRQDRRSGRSGYVEYFVVQKFVIAARASRGRGRDDVAGSRTTVFVCAGTCTAATAAALEELVQWRRLQRMFGDQPFAALYELRTERRELTAADHVNWPDSIRGKVRMKWSTPQLQG